MKKTYTLSRYGTAHVLTHNTTQERVTLKTYEDLTYHIKRFRLLHEIDGLGALPEFHRKQIGYVVEPVPICDVIVDILQGSGLTNTALSV